jgi:hypothetical protein
MIDAMKPINLVVFLAIRILGAQGRPETPADQAAGDAWWAQIKALASDANEGRLTGSEGYLRAARYVVSQFDAAGLQPAGAKGYYQPVKFDVTRVLADQSSAALLVDGRKEPLVLGKDAVLGARGTQPKSISAPLVFIGYGLHLPEAHYDDFNSISVKGKIVVFINGGPADLPRRAQIFCPNFAASKSAGRWGRGGRDLDSHTQIDGFPVGSRREQFFAARDAPLRRSRR